MTTTYYTCRRCGINAGSTSVEHIAKGLCFACTEDDDFPQRPLCAVCGKHRVTCSQAAFDRGVRVCRSCAYDETVQQSQRDYEPVLEIIRDFTGAECYVEQTGGMCMVATVYLKASDYAEGMCRHCERPIVYTSAGQWIDLDDEVQDCPGTVRGERPSPVHVPADRCPTIGITYDTDNTWTIGYERAWGDWREMETSDLPSGSDEAGRPIYGGEYATAEDVAARVLLLMADASLAV